MVWHRGDAMSATDVAAAARDATVIVHAVNPPGYRNWGELVLPMLDNTISAARTNGARIVLPGTVYNFGPDAFPDLHETSPQNAVTVSELARELQPPFIVGQVHEVVQDRLALGQRHRGNADTVEIEQVKGPRLEAARVRLSIRQDARLVEDQDGELAGGEPGSMGHA